MKPSQTSLNLIAVLTLSIFALVLFNQRRADQTAPHAQNAIAANPAPTELAVEEAQPTPLATPAPAAGATVAPPAAKPVADTSVPNGVPQELANDTELAYQLGEDISKLSPEALARLKADWKAHVTESQTAETTIQ